VSKHLGTRVCSQGVTLATFCCLGWGQAGTGLLTERWAASADRAPTCAAASPLRWRAPSAPSGTRRRQWRAEAFPPTVPYGKASVTVPPRGKECNCDKAGSSEQRPNTHPRIVSPPRRAAGSSLSAPHARSTPFPPPDSCKPAACHLSPAAGDRCVQSLGVT